MAQSIRTYISDGITTVFPVDFDLGYVDRTFVYVYTGDIGNYQNQLDYVWINDSQIELNTPVPNGQEFFIRRIVPRNEPLNDYVDGAILREKNLDDSFVQALMIWEELSDGFYSLDGETSFNFNLNMQGNSITGVEVDESDQTSVTTIEFTEEQYVNVDGDTMIGNLGGINSQASDHFMPQQQVTEVIDARMQTAPEFDPNQFIDYGLITETVDDELDYGGL